MNKYQECLENLRNWVLEYFYDEDGLEIGDQCLEDLFPVEFAIIQQAIDKAIKYDDKETPKKRIFVEEKGGISAHDECPICRVKVSPIRRYCDNCGQRLE